MEILLQIITIVCGLIGAIAVIIDIATSPKKKSFFKKYTLKLLPLVLWFIGIYIHTQQSISEWAYAAIFIAAVIGIVPNIRKGTKTELSDLAVVMMYSFAFMFYVLLFLIIELFRMLNVHHPPV